MTAPKYTVDVSRQRLLKLQVVGLQMMTPILDELNQISSHNIRPVSQLRRRAADVQETAVALALWKEHSENVSKDLSKEDKNV